MKSDEYRARARECLERASEVRDPEVRQQFKGAAEQWVHMADQVDRFGLSILLRQCAEPSPIAPAS
jgi:hypothetical protein